MITSPSWKQALAERRNLRTLLTYAFVAAVFLLATLPVLLRGSGALFAIHDSLDSMIPNFEMLRTNGLFFSLDAPTTMLHGVSSRFFSVYTMNLFLLPFAFLGTFRALLLGYLLHLVTAYVSMALLLSEIFPRHKNLGRLVAAAYMILPVFPAFFITYAAAPLLAWAFLRLARGPKGLRRGVLWLLCYLPFASFAHMGLFVLPLWFIAAVVLWVAQKKPNWNLFAGFGLLLLVCLATDYRLIAMVLSDAEPMIRETFTDTPLPFLATWWRDFTEGIYHAPPLQRLIVLPVIVAVSVGGRFLAWRRKESQLRAPEGGLRPCMLSLMLLGVAALFSLLYALYYTAFGSRLAAALLPFLDGFNWSRVSTLNRVVFYVAFAAALTALLPLRIRRFPAGKALCGLLVCLQIAATLRGLPFGDHMLQTYNLASHNLFYRESRESSIHALDWGEYYNASLFDRVKQDLGYRGEWTVAVGFVPGVLTWNGFSTLDGYLSSYPLAYKEAFRAVIAPALDHSPAFAAYYDGWGARAYVFNDGVPYEATVLRENPPITLRMDVDAFRALGGQYVLSRAEVENAETLGLTLLGRYDDGLYILWVYRAMPGDISGIE